MKDWITIGELNSEYKKGYFTIKMSDKQYVLGVYGAAPYYTPTMTLPDGTTVFLIRYSAAWGMGGEKP